MTIADKEELRKLVKKFYKTKKKFLFSEASLFIARRFSNEMQKYTKLTNGAKYLATKFFKEIIKQEINIFFK